MSKDYKPAKVKVRPLTKEKRTRLECEVEGLINSRNRIPSSRVLADTIVSLVEKTIMGERKSDTEAKPWGSDFAIDEHL